MVCILNKKDYEVELNELELIVGSENGAYRLLTENNGYTLDKDPWGNPSTLYKLLLDKYNGDRKKAILEKSKYYTSQYYKKNGNWTMGDKEPSLKDNIKPKLTFEKYSDIIQQRIKFIQDELVKKVQSGNKYTKKQLTYFKNQAEILFNNQKQKSIINSTNQALIQAFGLQKVEKEDGTVYYTSKTSTDGKYDLIVEFVNRLSDDEEIEGWYDYNAKSEIAHNIIKIALNNADPSTFDHELAHHYVRMFWNSPLIQDALSAVYEEGMTMEEVEEALVDTITDRRQALLTKTSDLFTSKFWNKLYEMLQQSFGRLTGNEREVVLNNIKNAFSINLYQKESLDEVEYSMHQGRMFKKSKYSEKRNAARELKSNERYHVLDSSDKLLSALSVIINKALKRRNILQNAGIISPLESVRLNKQEQRAKLFIEDINTERERYKQELKDSGEWVTNWRGKLENPKKLGNNKKERELSFEVIQDTLTDAMQDMNDYIEMLSNAQTYGFLLTAYVNDESVEDAISRKYIDNGNTTGVENVEKLTPDNLRTVGKETVAYYSKIISDINSLVKSPNAENYFSKEELELLDSQTDQLLSKKQQLEDLYNKGRHAQILQFIKNMIFIKDDVTGNYKVNPILNMDPDDAYAFYDEAIRWIDLSGVDISSWQTYIGVKEFSKSPITRMLHFLIFDELLKQRRACEADANKLRTLKRRAQKEAIKNGSVFSTLRTFDKMFLERVDGKFTGNILDRINRGKYLKNKDEWFDNVLYGKGFTYTKTDGKEILYGKNIELMCREALNDNSFLLDLDEKGEPLIPDNLENVWKAWEYAKEEFYSNNTEREFVSTYYKKRVEMLSHETLKAQRDITNEINKILKLCMVNGKPHTELLTVAQMILLKDAYKKQGLLSSHYDASGKEKETGSKEYKIMLELRAWKEVYPQISYIKDEEAYEESKSASTDPNQFRRQNSYRLISDFVWDVFKQQLNSDDNSEVAFKSEVMGRVVTLKELKSLRSELLSTIKEPGIVKPYWELIFDYETGHIREEAKQFLRSLKKIDLAIAEGNTKFEDPNANVAPIKNPVLSNADRIMINEKNKKVSVYKDMCDRIYKSWKESGDPLWNKKATEEIKLISYIRSKNKGQEGLSIFRYMKPNMSSLKNPKTGQYEKTILEVPIRIFSKLSKEKTEEKEKNLVKEGKTVNPVYNTKYNHNIDETVLPNEGYLNKDYLELENLSKKYPAMWDYYSELKSQMKESFESLPFTGSYNALAPLIGADWVSYCSRIMMRPSQWNQIGSVIKYVLKRFVGLTEDDQDIQIESWEKRNDGSIAKKIPVKYIKRLDDQNQINANLLYSVTAFREMAAQYQWRKKINGISLLLYENAYDKKQDNHIKELEDLIDNNIYGVDMTGLPTADTNVMWRTMYKFAKYSGIIKNMARLGLLGGNVTSGIVAATDAFCSILQDTIHHKYSNNSNFIKSIGHLVYSLPNAVMSYGSTKTDYSWYTDTNTLYNFFGMGESATRRFSNAHHSRIRKMMGVEKTLMSPFLFADYNTKAMYLEETLDNFRYIERFNKFMSEDEATRELMNTGMDAKAASSEYYNSKNIRSALAIDEFGNVVPSETFAGLKLKAMSDKEKNDLYTSISGRALSRTAYYNGMILESEKTKMLTNPWLSWVSMLRNFMIIMIAHKFSSNDDFFLYRTADAPSDEILDFIDNDEDFGKSIAGKDLYVEVNENRRIPLKTYTERTQHHRKGQYNFLRRDKYSPELKAFYNMFARLYDVEKEHSVWKRITHNFWELAKYYIKDIMSKKSYRQRGLNPFKDDLYSSKSVEQKQYRKEHLISYEEISAFNTVMSAAIMIAIGETISIVFHNTFADDYDLTLWFNLLDLILLRTPMEKVSGFSISTITELIKSITAGQTPIENFALLSLIYDVIMWTHDSAVTEVIKGNGTFVGKKKWEKDLLNTLSILGIKNIHKQMSVPAVKATKKFYTDMNIIFAPFLMPANPALWFKDNKKGFVYKKNDNNNLDINNINFDMNTDFGSFDTNINSNLDIDF